MLSIKSKFKILFSILILAGLVGFAGVAFAQPDLGISYGAGTGLGSADIRLTIARIIHVALGLLGIVAVGLTIYAGYMWMTAGGNSDQIGDAKKILINSVIGLAIILSAYSIVSFVISKLVDATRTYPSHCYNNEQDDDESDIDCGAVGGDCRVCTTDDCPDGSCLNFYVRTLPTGGDKCIRNINLKMIFTENVNEDSLNEGDNAVVVDKDNGDARVPGEWAVGNKRNEAIFTPRGDCGAPDNGDDCLASSTNYILNELSPTITSLSGRNLACDLGTAGCGPVEFKSGDGTDRKAPKVFLTAPAEAEQGTTVKLRVDFTDDNGLQDISVYRNNAWIGSVPLDGCQTEGSKDVDWNTTGVFPRTYNLEAIGTDWAAQEGTSTAQIAIRPPHCYNRDQDEDETDEDCGGADCGACDDSNCSANIDCASGFCDLSLDPPQCKPRLRIDDVDPWQGVSGNYVSIFGRYFGDDVGEVFFKKGTDGDGNIIWTNPATLPCGDLSPWSNSQIIVEVPATAIAGPIMVEAAATDARSSTYKVDTTGDDWGPVRRDFSISGTIKPGLCPISPNSGQPNTTVSLHGKNFGATLGEVNFGSLAARVLTDGWFKTLINVLVPLPPTAPTTVGVKVTAGGQDSNSVRFSILPSTLAEDSPRITGISPTHGAPGSYITITGNHLGKNVGKVWFKPGASGTGILGDFSFPEGCGNTWSDDQVVVKFPAATVEGVTPGEMYSVQIETADSVLTPIENNYFIAENGMPGPGLCKIDPKSTPLPLLSGDNMKVYGDNLAEASADVYQCNDAEHMVCGNDADCPSVSVPDLAGPKKCTFGDYVCSEDSDCADIYDMPPQGDGLHYLRIPTGEGICLKKIRGLRVYPISYLTYGIIFRVCSVDADCGIPSEVCESPQKDSWKPADNICVPSQIKTVPGECEPAGRVSGSAQIYFNAEGADALTIAGRKSPDSIISVANQLVELLPPLLSTRVQSGPVVAYRAADNKMSNSLNFEIRDCTKNENTCTTEGDQCCVSGIQKGQCISSGLTCSGITRSTGYIWRFSTKDIPPPLTVVERCDNVGFIGDLPSPSPSTILNELGVTSVHSQVCQTALIEVAFSRQDINPISKDQVGVFKCTGDPDVDGVCNEEVSVENTAADDVGGKYITASAHSTGLAVGAGENFLELRNTAGSWDTNTWYQVRLGVGITAGTGTSTDSLTPTRPCGADTASDTAYCFKFKTDSVAHTCNLSQVLITPAQYWTNQLVSPLRRYSIAVGELPLYYAGHGLSDQKCVMMDMTGYTWQWSSLDTEFAGIFAGGQIQNKMEVETLRNTQSILVNDAVNIHVKAEKDAGPFTQNSPLTIDLSDPQVIDHWPKCLEACTNAEVGLQFNIPMSNVNLGQSAIKLYKCVTEDCLLREEASTAILMSPARAQLSTDNKSVIELKVKSTGLNKNTTYQVVVSHAYDPVPANPGVALDTIWSVGKRTQDYSFSKPYNAEYSWKFRTKAEACKIDRVEVLPEVFTTRSITAKAIYGATPYSAPDRCSVTGQKLRATSVGWNWQSDPTDTAIVNRFLTVGYNKYCTGSCVRKGSDIPYDAVGTGVNGGFRACGNGILEAGEDCDPPLSGSCGLDCLFTGSAPVVAGAGCGNGSVEPDFGEECDPASLIPAESVNCNSKCLHIGSAVGIEASAVNASICGNEEIGVGEECDLGIPANPSISTSSLGCSAKCLHAGTRLTSAWCSANKTTGRGGFTEATFNSYCDFAYSKCGDRSLSLDEDPGCDGPTVLTLPLTCDQFCLKKSGECTRGDVDCSDSGLWAGSSLYYDNPSVCGDQQVGTGEEDFCENDSTFTITRSGATMFDPWVLARAVGNGPVHTDLDPPAQVADISAITNLTGGGNKSGSGEFRIQCGYSSDAECAVANDGDTSFGVGADSCCYARPKLNTVYPGTTSTLACVAGSSNPACNACPNTYIAASFDHSISKESLTGHLLIARKVDLALRPAPSMRLLGSALTENRASVQLTNPNFVSIFGDYAFVLARDDGAIEIINIASSTNYIHQASIVGFTSPNVMTVSRVGVDLVAYVGDNEGGVTYVNVSDIAAPGAKQRYVAHDHAQISGIFVDNGRVYVVYRDIGAITVLDAVSGNKLAELQYSDATYQESAITVKGNHAYIHQGDVSLPTSSIFIIDVSGESSSWHVNSGTLLGTNVLGVPRGLSWYGEKLVVGSGKGLSLLDVSDPTLSPAVLASNNSASVSTVDVRGKYAFVGLNDRIRIFDLSNTVLPEVGNFNFGESTVIRNLKYSQNKLYIVSDGIDAVDDKFRIIDVSDWFRAEDDYCFGASDVTSLVVAGSQEVNSQEPWYQRIWQRLTYFVNNLLGSSSAQAETTVKWCAGNDIGLADVVDQVNEANVVSTSTVVVRLNRPLSFNTDYKIILTDEVKDTRGVSIGRPESATTTNWSFKTSDKICEVDSVSVTPNQYFFSIRNSTTTLWAQAHTALDSDGRTQIIQPIPQAYYWNYLWGPANLLVALTSTTADTNEITAGNSNGEIDLAASANITENNYTGEREVVASGNSHIIVFLCSNPWPPKDLIKDGNRYKIFPYEDKVNNNDGYDLVNDVFDNTAIPASITTSDTNGYYNFSTYYCADNGALGTYDDLPFLRSAVQVSSTIVSATTSLKRFIFTDKYGHTSDAIGVQIFANPDFSTLADWMNKQTPRISGDFHSIKIGGYDALADSTGNNYYIEALNYTEHDPSHPYNGVLYSDIYLFSLNINSGAGMRKVFEQMLSNLNFNTNLTNYGVCGVNSHTPSFNNPKLCTTDFDCAGVTGATVCAVQTDKLKRNYQRLRDLQSMTRLINNYYFKSASVSASRYYPKLTEGSYLSGQTVSTWPSWGTLGNLLGKQLPRDPANLNSVAPAGTCKIDTARYCLLDSQCVTADNPTDTCVLHNSTTGWSTEDRRFSFACNPDSLAYRYVTNYGSAGYQVRAQMENPTLILTNWDLIKNKFFLNPFQVGLEAPLSFYDLVSPGYGICLQGNEIQTIHGVCGDGQLNLDQGEECEPVGAISYDAECSGFGSSATQVYRTCQPVTCTWGADQSGPCVARNCGNGNIDPGEVCDDGAGLNGRAGHCDTDCVGHVASTCGNDTLNEPSEFCDNKAGKCRFAVSANVTPLATGPCSPYALNKNQSCRSDCSGFGAYCGDGAVDAANGEECESNQSCSINGLSGTKVCNSCSTDNTLAISSWKFNDIKPIPLPSDSFNFYSPDSRAQYHVFCSTESDCPILVDGRPGFGKAVKFDGINDSFVLTSNPDFNGNQFSISVWIKPTGADVNDVATIITKKHDDDKGFALNYRYNKAVATDGSKGYAILQFYGLGHGTKTSVVGSVPLNVWTNIIATYDGASANLYINGTQQGSGENFNMFVSDSQLFVGNDVTPSTIDLDNYFKGEMDNLAYYNHALNDTEITSIAGSAAEWLCTLNDEVAPIPIARNCGDGAVGEDEVCDNGVDNGVPCASGYNRSCSYCSSDCRNIISKEPAGYCGDGVINGPEVCEKNASTVYVTSTSPLAGGSYNRTYNGNTVKLCSDEINYNINLQANIWANWMTDVNADATVKKGVPRQTGTRACSSNCLAVEDNCASCGGNSPDGVTVSGYIVNVLEPASTNPLYAQQRPVGNDPGAYDGHIQLVYTPPSVYTYPAYHPSASPAGTYFNIFNANLVGCATFPLSMGTYNSYTLRDPVDCYSTGVSAKINPDERCYASGSSSGRGSSYLVINGYQNELNPSDPHNEIRRQLFPVTSAGALDSGKYDLLLSPRLSVTTTPGHIRVVVSWNDKGRASTDGLVAGFLTAVGRAPLEYSAFNPVIGRAYFNNIGERRSGIWYHGFKSLLSRTAEYTFTVDVNNFDAGIKDYIFYVRTADGRRISDYQNAKVDIYLPDNHGDPTSEDNIIVSGVVSTEFRDGRRFSFPYRTYELSKARRSDNNEASVWHVLNFHSKSTYDQIAGLENLYDTNLNRFVTEGWLDFSYPY